ncbi:SLC13 family permease [Alkalihalobacillus sp. AL-G]|uniref:SLC13 family permease n=1 Tax=Alkalihalobacillus sp. AL-G TaxID=2926399 RepID=UPI00272BC51D|nr:SLC13 family permease [Alkalihalobacillus sp. AL-G]WLD94960.1 anion permease [Alkalihalobacillus sp. AL-G]
MISLEILITYSVIFVMFLFLVMNWYSAEIVILSVVMILVWTGIISLSEAFVGFTNEATLTIAALFVIMTTIQKHPSFSKVTGLVFGGKQTLRGGLSRMMVVTAGVSGFMNNTPLVVLLTPIVKKWCKKHSIYPSKLLIPLSYAAIIGGMCTLIGTSTNLVVHTLMLKEGFTGFTVFELALIGVPIFVFALIYMTLLGHRLLPDYPGNYSDVKEYPQFFVEVQVNEDYPLVGKTIKEAGLRTLKRGYVMAILRQGECLFPVSSQQIIKKSDHLLFVGDTSCAEEINQFTGLTVEKIGYEFTYFGNDYKFVEAVVPQHSEFITNKIRDLNFRSKYDGVVVAVYRNGTRINEKIGTIRLKAGDMLYILTSDNSSLPMRASGNLILLTNHSSSKGVSLRDWIPVTVFGLMITCVALGVLQITQAAITTVILFLLLRFTTFEEAKDSIKWEVLFIIGGAFGIAEALINSGAAEHVANSLLFGFGNSGPIALLVMAYLITNLLTELITNNAAAVIVFPIIMTIVNEFSFNPEPFAVAIAIASSASFATPIGYQTNLLVYSSGQYRFSDFLKIGLPLNIVCFITSIIMIPLFWPLT